jgi:hypothetical protein
MFERYTEGARRTIFFARYEAVQVSSDFIEKLNIFFLVCCAKIRHYSGVCCPTSNTNPFTKTWWRIRLLEGRL